ncbi:hypothetical protein [uncultured Campylobacter sp.]|nr:hypothetical protein [uncultured Campylobacter sp.]
MLNLIGTATQRLGLKICAPVVKILSDTATWRSDTAAFGFLNL